MVAGAKINLCLRVGALRADGYHEVATVLAALALGDDVELDPAPATSVEAPGLPGGDSIVTRALGLLAERTGHAAGWRVRIDKHVPAGAGLGGGSADAAAALGLANATLPEPLQARELLALAAEVGSDVPFFLTGDETALARGRGELLEPCPVGAAAWVVVAWPGVPLGTAEVYGRYRPAADAHERVASLAAEPFATGDVEQLAGLVENDLAAPAEELCPPCAELRGQLLDCKALAASLSGSGSAVFGVFAAEEPAQAAFEQLRGRAPWKAIGPLTQARGATISA
ncbi:MAG TPA: 4-(cytidine 5'-diphospho)-2-C-methyl-D-erythritol kinase [Gaiellales bacterium]|nr:4-(cytidine 5'-diphospho)-2-C-methyl-D-erythritol kinase [Gaiellales bacterium]